MELDQVVSEIQAHRDSKVIIYATSDRPNLPLAIEEDVIEVFHSHLEEIGKYENLDLVLYSRGGSTVVPLPMVRMLRKYCAKLGILVPFRAHSAATMICVGGDEIYMTKKAELGPVDPQITGLQNRRYASTDLFAYFEFARDQLGWQKSNSEISSELMEFMHKYSNLPPDIVGKIYRLYTQARKYIDELVDSHSQTFRVNKEFQDSIAETLTAGFGSHDYKIDSNEAKKKLGLNMLDFDTNLESLLNTVYSKLVTYLKLNTAFPDQEPTATQRITARAPMGIIKSEKKESVKYADYSLSLDNQGKTVATIKPSGWE